MTKRANPKITEFEDRLKRQTQEGYAKDSPVWYRGTSGKRFKDKPGPAVMGKGLYLTRQPEVAKEYAEYKEGEVVVYFVNMDTTVLDQDSPEFLEAFQSAVDSVYVHPNVKHHINEALEEEDVEALSGLYGRYLSEHDELNDKLTERLIETGYRGVYSKDDFIGLILFYPHEDAVPYFVRSEDDFAR